MKYTFPKRFLWGAATSAHQVEGGLKNQWSAWELENAKSLAKQAEYKLNELPVWHEVKDQATKASNYTSGKAANHYRLYEKDFEILSELNMNAFRFSIEWSRVEPEEGKWDVKAIEYYRKYLIALRRRKIEPMVTLFHWTTPVWFDQKGGFEKAGNVKYFTAFAEKVFDELGEHMRLVCILNEPESVVMHGYVTGDWPPMQQGDYVKAIKVYKNLARAHNKVAQAAKKRSRRLKVGVSKGCAYHYAADTSWKSKVSVRTAEYIADYWFLNRIKKHLDWLGLNYYFSFGYENGRMLPPKPPMNDLGWEMAPDDMQFVLERLYKKYRKPLIVTESGVADRNDRYRKWWIAHSIDAIHKAMQNGARVEGYLHWSLLDNFEWAYGKWPRFGLVEVDYKTFKRAVRPSARWFGKVIAQLRKAS